MDWSPIAKPRGTLRREPCLADYDEARREFAWEQARALLDGLPGRRAQHRPRGRRPARAGPGGRPARHPLPRAGRRRRSTCTYRRTRRRRSHRFANVLARLGVQRGERVATLMGRIPALYATVLGTLAAGAVYCPLFSAFGPEPVKARLRSARCACWSRPTCCTDARSRRSAASCPACSTCSSCARPARATCRKARWTSTTLMGAASPDFAVARTSPEDYALLHFTSGTTGKPKGVLHAHAAVTAHLATARWVLDLQDGDVYWCTADPGWVTGISYGVIAPLACGVAHDRGPRGVRRAALVRDPRHASASRVWYTAPTAIRMLMKAGVELARARDVSGAAPPRERRRAAQSRSGASGASRPSACRSTTPGGRPRPARS